MILYIMWSDYLLNILIFIYLYNITNLLYIYLVILYSIFVVFLSNFNVDFGVKGEGKEKAVKEKGWGMGLPQTPQI